MSFKIARYVIAARIKALQGDRHAGYHRPIGPGLPILQILFRRAGQSGFIVYAPRILIAAAIGFA